MVAYGAIVVVVACCCRVVGLGLAAMLRLVGGWSRLVTDAAQHAAVGPAASVPMRTAVTTGPATRAVVREGERGAGPEGRHGPVRRVHHVAALEGTGRGGTEAVRNHAGRMVAAGGAERVALLEEQQWF